MSTANVFHSALRLLLRPIVRYCLAHAIRLQEIVEVLKQVLVEVGVDTLEQQKCDVTIARVAVMTGVHRKDTLRLMDRREVAAPATGSLISRIVGQWQGDRRFTNQTGKPRVLTCAGAESEFTELVRAVSRELNASLVLSELERIGTVERTNRGVRLVSTVLEVKGDAAEGLALLAEDMADLMTCVEENITGNGESKYLHIKTEFDSIPDALLPEIREHVLREGTKFHRALSAYLGSKDKDVNQTLKALPGANRVAVGSFSISSNRE